MPSFGSPLPVRSSRRVGRVIVVGSALALVCLSACSSSKAPGPGATDTVTRASVSNGVSSVGSLASANSQDLGFAKGGQLTKVNVQVGDKVAKGDVLAKIDTHDLKQALAQQQANLHQQEAILARIDQNPAVAAAQNTLNQSRRILSATRRQVDATRKSDATAVSRAKDQLDFDHRYEDKTERRLHDAEDNCVDPVSCQSAAAAAISAHEALKTRVEASETALAAAEQRKKVDAATGQVSLESSQQSVVSAQNSLSSVSSDRPHNLDQQVALVDSADAGVKTARKAVDDATLIAPFDGTVDVVNGKKGEFLSPSSGTTALAPGTDAAIPGADSSGGAPGAPGAAASPNRPGGSQFIVLSGGKKLQAVLPFEESDALQIQPGQNVDLAFDAFPDLTQRGTVVSVSPSSTAISGTINYYVTVGITKADSRLTAGQSVRATVLTGEADDVLTVPNAAVQQQGSDSTVVVVEPNGNQHPVTFQPGVVGSERTEVLSGLSEGQRVVIPTGAQ